MLLNRTAKLILASLFLFVGGLASLSAEDVKGDLVATMPVPEGLSAKSRLTSITSAAAARGWTVLKANEEKVIINLIHRGWDSTLTIEHNDTQFLIYSDSWTTDKAGEKKKRKEPTGWINNIKRDISVAMTRELYSN